MPSIERKLFARCCAEAAVDELPLFFFTTERAPQSGSDETVYSRMLAPGFGITEDPATGGASGPLGCYLVHYEIVPSEAAHSMLSLQGVAMSARAASTSRSMPSMAASPACASVGAPCSSAPAN